VFRDLDYAPLRSIKNLLLLNSANFMIHVLFKDSVFCFRIYEEKTQIYNHFRDQH
jgi:hypothetical protein